MPFLKKDYKEKVRERPIRLKPSSSARQPDL